MALSQENTGSAETPGIGSRHPIYRNVKRHYAQIQISHSVFYHSRNS